jgi:hypothetical protein
MGKGIALMFSEAFPANTQAYQEACKEGRIHVGQMFVTGRCGNNWCLSSENDGVTGCRS